MTNEYESQANKTDRIERQLLETDRMLQEKEHLVREKDEMIEKQLEEVKKLKNKEIVILQLQ